MSNVITTTINSWHELGKWRSPPIVTIGKWSTLVLIFPFCFHLFLRTLQQPNPFCCNRSTTNLFMISFLSRTVSVSELWIYLWLAETSQQPISQTTWLRVTPHCNHCERQEDTQHGFPRAFARLVLAMLLLQTQTHHLLLF